MFERLWHRDVLRILDALDAELLAKNGFLFGGVTRLVLELREFRESLDIDFLCSDASGYGELRALARDRGYPALFREGAAHGLTFPREMRVDQYGIRFPVACNGNTIKVELIREGRIDLGPGMRPEWSPVDCLSIPDCFAIKLLANSDRWPDRQVLARDLIDLSALRMEFGSIPEEAWTKAEVAYKAAVRQDLRKALALLTEDLEFQRRCFDGLRIRDSTTILCGLPLLAGDLDS